MIYTVNLSLEVVASTPKEAAERLIAVVRMDLFETTSDATFHVVPWKNNFPRQTEATIVDLSKQ